MLETGPRPLPGGVPAAEPPAQACSRKAPGSEYALAPPLSTSSPAPSHLRPQDAMTHSRFADVAAAQRREGGDFGLGGRGGRRGTGGRWQSRMRPPR